MHAMVAAIGLREFLNFRQRRRTPVTRSFGRLGNLSVRRFLPGEYARREHRWPCTGE